MYTIPRYGIHCITLQNSVKVINFALLENPFRLLHIGESLDGDNKAIHSLVGVAACKAVLDTVIHVPFKDNLRNLIERAFGGANLGEHVFAWRIAVYHAVDRLNLPYYLLESYV